MERTSTRTLVAKRRACVNCTAAKARCDPRLDNTCDRCFRTGGQCVYLDMPARKRRRGESRRFENLESKFEGLVAQLSTLANQSSSATGASHISNLRSSPHHVSLSSVPSASTASASQSFPISTSAPASFDDAGARVLDDVVDLGLIDLQAAEARLAEFRNDYTLHFPFVPIDPTRTIDSVRHESPVTFLAIMAATEIDRPSVQEYLGRKLRCHICTRIALHGESSLDLLRGLLIYISWYQHFIDRRNPQVFFLIQLCGTLVHELGLEKRASAHGDVEGTSSTAGHEFSPSSPSASNWQTDETSDGMRALLGAYHFSVSAAKALRKPCAMRFTNYMAKCCRQLRERGEYISDGLVEPLVRLQNLTNSVAEAFSYFDPSTTSVHGDAAIWHTVQQFNRELNSIKATFPTLPSKPACDVWALETNSFQSWIYEVAFHDHLWNAESEEADRRKPDVDFHGSTNVPSIRTNMLWRLVDANNNYLRQYLALSDSDLRRLSFTSFSKLCYVLISQAKVTFALLDFVGPTTDGSMQEELRPQSMFQLVVNRVNYNRACVALIDKFDTVCGDGEGGKAGAIQNYGNLAKSMMLGLSKQLQERSRAMTANRERTAWNVSVQQPDVVGTLGLELGPESPPQRTGTGIAMTGDWDNIDMMLMDGVTAFDEAEWDAILNEFMVPYSTYAS